MCDEVSRLKPVIKGILPSVSIPISIDTMKTKVASVCIDLGVDMINDINGLRDIGMIDLCANSGVDVVISHMHGTPDTMQLSVMGPNYMEEIRRFLLYRAKLAIYNGISKSNIILDPGIGFGKSFDQDINILKNGRFFSGGFPVLLGSSRKKFLSKKFSNMEIDDASALAAKLSINSGADIVRVHNV